MTSKINKRIFFLIFSLSLFNLCAGMDNSVHRLNKSNNASIVECEQDEEVFNKQVELKPLMKSHGSYDSVGNPDKDVLIIIEDDKAPKNLIGKKLESGLAENRLKNLLEDKSKGLLKLKNGKVVAKTRFEEIPADVFRYEIFPILDVNSLQGVHQTSTALREEVEEFIFRVDLSKYEEDFLSRIDFANYAKVSKSELVKEFVEKIINEVVGQVKQELEKSNCKKIPLLFVRYGRERLEFLTKDNVKKSWQNMEKSLEKDFEILFSKKYLKLRRIMRPVRLLIGVHFLIVVPIACLTGTALGIVLAFTL